ncbi:hypothetical protein F4804DRAFT_313964 [Jackrogersella minutella]|nr:hypothetical protein F4804DRAFT_313964 [Jackrogersella minutella]
MTILELDGHYHCGVEGDEIKVRFEPNQPSIQHKEDCPPNLFYFVCGGKILENGRTLSDYNIQRGSVLHMIRTIRAGDCTVPMGIAAGGRIEQNIVEDTMDATQWAKDMTMTIPLQILNSVAFRRVTGKKPPPSPVKASTYADAGLPFFSMYEEPSGVAGNFQVVKSVNEIEQDRGLANGAESSVHPSIVKLDERGGGITIPNRHTLSIRDPDGLMDSAGPLHGFRAVADLERDPDDEV